MIPMADKTYSGWTNYETWCVNLWLTNEPGSAETLLDIVKSGQGGMLWKEVVLKEYVEFYIPDMSGVYSDLLRSALDNVNWREIIENHLED